MYQGTQVLRVQTQAGRAPFGRDGKGQGFRGYSQDPSMRAILERLSIHREDVLSRLIPLRTYTNRQCLNGQLGGRHTYLAEQR
jgi:hypothetical protein